MYEGKLGCVGLYTLLLAPAHFAPPSCAPPHGLLILAPRAHQHQVCTKQGSRQAWHGCLIHWSLVIRPRSRPCLGKSDVAPQKYCDSRVLPLLNSMTSGSTSILSMHVNGSHTCAANNGILSLVLATAPIPSASGARVLHVKPVRFEGLLNDEPASCSGKCADNLAGP
jgi:hypothetical protein